MHSLLMTSARISKITVGSFKLIRKLPIQQQSLYQYITCTLLGSAPSPYKLHTRLCFAKNTSSIAERAEVYVRVPEVCNVSDDIVQCLGQTFPTFFGFFLNSKTRFSKYNPAVATVSLSVDFASCSRVLGQCPTSGNMGQFWIAFKKETVSAYFRYRSPDVTPTFPVATLNRYASPVQLQNLPSRPCFRQCLLGL